MDLAYRQKLIITELKASEGHLYIFSVDSCFVKFIIIRTNWMIDSAIVITNWRFQTFAKFVFVNSSSWTEQRLDLSAWGLDSNYWSMGVTSSATKCDWDLA